jgi:hypothetical protein
MGRNCEMKYESSTDFSRENLYKYTPKTYTYEIIKNKIRETGGQYHFEFNIYDIITKGMISYMITGMISSFYFI